jgi:hypothetical protein
MKYTFSVTRQFAGEVTRMDEKQRDLLGAFFDIYEVSGLKDQTVYPGRLSQSWHGLPPNHPNHIFSTKYSLWHYHCGYPKYETSKPWGNTSDWLIHFQWVKDSTHIDVVDMYQHHTYNKQFYLPSQERLVEPSPSSIFGDEELDPY